MGKKHKKKKRKVVKKLMNIKRKVIKVEIEDKEYDMILDFESAINFQDDYGQSIFVGMNNVNTKQDIFAIACIIASCVKNEDGESLGLGLVKKFDLLGSMDYFVEKFGELIENSVPKEEEESKKK